MVAKAQGEDANREENAQGRYHRREQKPVANVGDGGGVVHHTVDGITDALVVKGGHGQGLDPRKEERAIVMVERLC